VHVVGEVEADLLMKLLRDAQQLLLPQVIIDIPGHSGPAKFGQQGRQWK